MDEVLKCTKKLKNNQSRGYDGIVNEFLKTSSSKLLISVTVLFKTVLLTGKISHACFTGYISPIYKRKCKVNDPDNCKRYNCAELF